MKKQLSLITTSILVLIMLSSTLIQSAAEQSDTDSDTDIDEMALTRVYSINIIEIANEQLWEAAKKGNLKKAKKALAEGADVNGEYDKFQLTTPLQIAAENGHVRLVKLLLKRGAHVDATVYNATPLGLICTLTYHHLETSTIVKDIVTELLKYRANVNAQPQGDFLKNTPLMRAIYFGQKNDVIRQLILAGGDVTIKNKRGKTALDLISTESMRIAINEALEDYAQIQTDIAFYHSFFARNNL